jgi:phosphoserine aminotransferase
MLAVEDYLFALDWATAQGGTSGLVSKANSNLKVLANFVAEVNWLDFLAIDPNTRSNTSVCLKIVDPRVTSLDAAAQMKFAKSLAKLLDDEAVAYDIGSYRDAPAGLRIWTGCTVEQADLIALIPWLSWAFETQIKKI